MLLAFHLGPTVSARLAAPCAELRWGGGHARVTLPGALAWRAHRGETAPPFGWYSRGFGQREPATVLAGRGTLAPGMRLETRFVITEGES